MPKTKRVHHTTLRDMAQWLEGNEDQAIGLSWSNGIFWITATEEDHEGEELRAVRLGVKSEKLNGSKSDIAGMLVKHATNMLTEVRGVEE